MKRTGIVVSSLSVVLLSALMFALVVPGPAALAAKEVLVKTSDPPPPTPSDEDFALLDRLSRVANYIGKTASAAVVHITATKVAKPSKQQDQDSDEFFRRFFPDERGPFSFKFGPQQPEPQVGLGSGAVIDPNGYIVTNNHVVEGADKIKVVFPDGREFVPQWVRTDPPSDVALIKIEATGLPYLEMGDSDQVQIGDWVLAIGNPFGLDNTVTQGIVSYVGRGVPVSSSIKYSNYIQTDAAINPGNSGGPLVGRHGKIIALNSAILSRTATYAGIGFAIPINTVKFVVSQLKQSEQVVRSYLGVSIQNLDLPLAKYFGRPDIKGALVGEITPDSPAAKAGLKPGDIILAFDGVRINNSQHLQNMVAERKPGTTVHLQIWRDKKMMEVSVALERMPKEFFAGRMTPKPEEEAAPNQTTIKDLGIVVSSVTPDLAEKYNLKNDQGALIVQVDPQGEGSRLGLSEGDLILRVENQKITSVQDLTAILKRHPLQKGVTLYVKSASGGSRWIYTKPD